MALNSASPIVLGESRFREANSQDKIETLAEAGKIFNLNYGIIGQLIGADFNVTTDQDIPTGPPTGTFIIDRILVTNASISLTTAAGGIYTAASKGGSAIVAAGQVYSALTAATKFIALTLAITDTRWSAGTLRLSLTTPQGAASTADIYIMGWRFD